ncbi:hypothetical protein HPB47_010969 [Ixodes persulcatus]|uniref:Uncharacterized protein n=1 Tax=Ixodes persulcatus TaxID=34615 RepID=A0AC60NXV5_IXOPE|nr:hypothetical protein HPB47_010969 [Ixodes persulcatus]
MSAKTVRRVLVWDMVTKDVDGMPPAPNVAFVSLGDYPVTRLYKDNNLKIQLAMARSIQGLHGPIKLMAERKAASQVGRLPFLPSSNVMLDALEGGDETITFEDIYNEALEGETLRPPHMVMEKHLNML